MTHDNGVDLRESSGSVRLPTNTTRNQLLERYMKQYKEFATSEHKETYRMVLFLPPDAYHALLRLRDMTGKKTLSETIMSAMDVMRKNQ